MPQFDCTARLPIACQHGLLMSERYLTKTPHSSHNTTHPRKGLFKWMNQVARINPEAV